MELAPLKSNPFLGRARRERRESHEGRLAVVNWEAVIPLTEVNEIRREPFSVS